MSQLVGLISRSADDVTRRLLDVLGSPIKHDAYGEATSTGAEHRPGLFDFTSLTGCAAIGHRLVKVHPTDNPQPVVDGGRAIAFLGRLWDRPEPCVPAVLDTLRRGDNGFRELSTGCEGSWAAVVAEGDAITCSRDTLGSVPLYYGENRELIGVSTDTKTLLGLGMEARRVTPGHTVTLRGEGIRDEQTAPLSEPRQTSVSLEEATCELDKLLTLAASRMSRGLNSPTLAFSGGIDSTLIAHYLKLAGARPRLTCVGAPDSRDAPAAEAAADALGLPIQIKTVTEDDLEERLPHILASVEEADPMKVGVAAPLHFVAREATRKPCRAVFSGNGSDELFGGYAKYAREYQERGESVRQTMLSDVARSHEVNLERDWKTCSDQGLELRLPFIDPAVVSLALGLPTAYKLPPSGPEPRKIILRKLAKRIGLPDDVANRPKKAAQYSTGFSKMLERIARGHGMSVAGYLASMQGGRSAE